MCGIFGIFLNPSSDLPGKQLKSLVDHAFQLSESRGKEASGLAIRIDNSIYILKQPIAASLLIKSQEYSDIFKHITKNDGHSDGNLSTGCAIIGHSRLVTNGRSELNTNNQPVIKDGAVGIHNGIIVNDSEIWQSFPEMEKKYDVDTEAFLSLLQMFRRKDESPVAAVKETFKNIQGSASVAVLFDDSDMALLASNTGSLYTCMSRDRKTMVFASERYILRRLLYSRSRSDIFDNNEIVQVKAGSGLLVDLVTMKKHAFTIKSESGEDDFTSFIRPTKTITITREIPMRNPHVCSVNYDRYILNKENKRSMMETWERLYSGEMNLRRCTRCLLPETIPYINFNENGICNHCRTYEKRGSIIQGEKALEEFVSKYRSRDGSPDCVVGFSGGRDSSYGLEYIKNKLGLNPITFIYDWGMVTDLARRNQARVCSELGIEQILISADIKRKRANIHKNLEAWLRKPDLGMLPILMAGDKRFYQYFHKIRRENDIDLFIFCGGYEGEESTGIFKLGFCGVNRNEKSAEYRMTGISLTNKLKLLWYYLKNYISNPAYINSSLFDTMLAYYWSYMLPDDYVYLYKYIEWDEDKIVSTIKKNFRWEQEKDTVATWRTDDGTASLYNYIYMTMASFTEYDTIRSHQIREGKMQRETAFELTKQENKPRFESIEWYAEAVDVDVNRMISIINAAPKRYRDAASIKP